MLVRTTLIGVLAAASVCAQPGPPPGRGMGMGGGARFLGAEPGMPGRVVKNAPFSAEMITETAQTLPDGNRIRQTNTSHYYRDSDGRTRREQSLNSLNGLAPNSNLPRAVFINDPVSRTIYALNPADKTATKSTWNPSPGERGPRPADAGGNGPGRPADMMARGMRRSGQNVKTESLGRQTIEGVPADGRRTTMTIPAGQIGNEQPIQIVSETWYSPELQTVVLSKRSDPRSGETSFRLANITRGDPPRTLFEPPADFKITESGRGMRGLRQ